MTTSKIIWTKTDEAPALATYALLPVIQKYTQGTGIEDLKEKIRQTSGVADFDLQQPACFTCRQEDLLQQLTNVGSSRQAALIITELVNGHI